MSRDESVFKNTSQSCPGRGWGDGDASSFVMSCVKLARRLKIKMADGSDECLSYWLWESEMKGRRNQDITKKERVEL